MIERLPESARTPAVARAIMSPTGILLAGAGAAVGIVSGAGVVGAVVLGALGWAGRVAVAILRRPREERIDPFTLQEPWRTLVNKALWTARRFDDAVRKTKHGPLRDRLADVALRVHTGVREAWAIAKRGHALDEAVQVLDVEGIRRDLGHAERQSRGGGGGRQDHEVIVRSLRNQLESAERLASVAEDAQSRLRRLNAELDEAVARAIELSLSAVDAGQLQPLGSDVENVVGELEALRLALEETEGPSAARGY